LAGKVQGRAKLMHQKSDATHVPANAAIGSDTLPLNRRKRTRLRVQWRLQFCAAGCAAVETVTQDLSSEGLYCLVGAPFVPGEVRECILYVPARDPEDDSRSVPVPCSVRVVRLEGLAETGLYGVACRVETYHFAEGTTKHGTATGPALGCDMEVSTPQDAV
jgi:hypothetical protein